MAGGRKRGLVVATALAVLAAAASIANAAGPDFCSPQEPLRDFGLSELPPVNEVPETGEELGHPALDIHGGEARVMSEPESFGYGFSEHDYSGTVELNWTVTAQLWAVDRRGREFREVDRNRLFIGRLGGPDQPSIEVHPPEDARGFYRFDIQFSNEGRNTLGSYSAYFKVVRPFWKVRLGLDREMVRPGERLLSRVENLGTLWLAYAEPFGVQRLESGVWTNAPEFTEHRWLKWLGWLGPGGGGRCNALILPTDTSPGEYRLVKGVRKSLSSEGEVVSLTAPFRVLGD